MTTIKKELNGLTIRELKELIKDIDENTEISVWNDIGISLQKLDIEIVKYDFGDIDVNINVE